MSREIENNALMVYWLDSTKNLCEVIVINDVYTQAFLREINAVYIQVNRSHYLTLKHKLSHCQHISLNYNVRLLNDNVKKCKSSIKIWNYELSISFSSLMSWFPFILLAIQTFHWTTFKRINLQTSRWTIAEKIN